MKTLTLGFLKLVTTAALGLTLSACGSGQEGKDELCGNGTLDNGEECDGSELGAATCENIGYKEGGTLACQANCQYDVSGCKGQITDNCGNGKIDEGEQCDGDDLGGKTCQSIGWQGGTLECDRRYCLFDTGICTGSPCGNGRIDTAEDCDGNDLGGNTCENLGFKGGTLKCDEKECFLDASDCQE